MSKTTNHQKEHVANQQSMHVFEEKVIDLDLKDVDNADLQHIKKTNKSEFKPMVRSFGRIKSRKLSKHKNFLLKQFIKPYEIKDLSKNNEHESGDNFCSQSYHRSCEQNYLEIGFGFGDFLYKMAEENPGKKFFGFEPHLNGVANFLAKLETSSLNNIKISTQDIRFILPQFCDEFFCEIFILFPDPWPKSKHLKRRLINSEFLDNFLAPKLQKDGKLIIATDHSPYKTWILSHILQSKKFVWTAKSQNDWQNFPTFWHKTKYQKKAEAEGRVSSYLELIRI